MFERETRREKILEARNKEIRLKEKTKGILGLSGAGSKAAGAGKLTGFALTALKGSKAEKAEEAKKQEAEEDPIVKAEREFFEIIRKEQEARLNARKGAKIEP